MSKMTLFPPAHVNLVTLFLLIFTRSIAAVRTCYFCADEESNCKKNDHSFQPVKMTCETFLIGNEPINKFFKRPNIFRQSSDEIYTVGLPSKNIKTICVKVRYRHKGGGFGFWNHTKTQVEFYFQNATFVFQTCMYQKLADYKNACHYFGDIFEQKSFDVKECMMCKTQDCNLAEFLINSTKILLLALLVLIYFH